ncbi:Nidogen-1 [Liparis tanakae]|uniref:Nidogen-1 n=1 Tax=Liparis tanakae TaxID=230148 RepID=A0A4Z2EUS3_9TELE|nr:Nidogen-1 [Liparis tanakae]
MYKRNFRGNGGEALGVVEVNWIVSRLQDPEVSVHRRPPRINASRPRPVRASSSVSPLLLGRYPFPEGRGINTNGFVSVVEPPAEGEYLGKMPAGFKMIAALLGDLEDGDGQVHFRLDSSPRALSRAADHVRRAFPRDEDVEPTSVVVVTWENMAARGTSGRGDGPDAKRNTFQLVVASMVSSSCAIFLKTNAAQNGVWVYEIGSSPFFVAITPGMVSSLPEEEQDATTPPWEEEEEDFPTEAPTETPTEYQPRGLPEQNPCFTGRHGCDINAACRPADGLQFACDCAAGFTGDGRYCHGNVTAARCRLWVFTLLSHYILNKRASQ